jgi:NAD(P)-dependent dehydrogenase (short-subunit alcohol dehydrogenase family)
MKVDLQDKIAVVTGAARGIGAATARVLAENGAIVIVADIDEATAHETAKGIPRAHALRLDVSNQAEVEAGIDWVTSTLGRVDILINNAGINTMHHRVTIDEFPVEEWDRIINVDLRGLFLVSRSGSAVMVRHGSGRIVNVSSVLGVVPARLQCAFNSAKAGVINLTRSMAIELAAKGILVNCIAPGSILTAATEQLFYSKDAIQAERRDKILSHIPLGRTGTVEEIASTILFLVAPESSYITGQTLCVDGGWSAGGFFRDF